MTVQLGSVDRSSSTPAYRQIADQLRESIRSGEMGPGDQLPSETQFMEHYGTARMTVRQALGELRSEGLIVAEHGRGVFVRERPAARRHIGTGFAADTEVDELETWAAEPPDDVRRALGADEGEKTVVESDRTLLDGGPVELSVLYRLEGPQRDEVTAVDEVSTRMPTPEERRRLDLGPGVPVLVVRRTTFDTAGRAVRVRDAVRTGTDVVLEFRTALG